MDARTSAVPAPAATAFVLDASSAGRFLATSCERQLFDAAERTDGRATLRSGGSKSLLSKAFKDRAPLAHPSAR